MWIHLILLNLMRLHIYKRYKLLQVYKKKKKNCPISLDCFLDPFFMIVKCYPLIQQFHIAITVAMSHPKQRIAVINNAGVMFKILRVKTRFSKISLKMDKNDTLTAIPNKCMLASKISKI
uniref:Uncharacterized protein n=1 Tax=Populus trichocarpa TaxID=3694 RepID=A0A2K1Y1S2_POPTR